MVVAWRHKALPGLARALGATTGECPDPWPGELYDLVLRFDYAEGARPEGDGADDAVLTAVIPGRRAAASPEPINTALAHDAQGSRAFAVAGGYGFRALASRAPE